MASTQVLPNASLPEPAGPPAAPLSPERPLGHRTHEVINQSPPLVGLDLASTDPALREGLRRIVGDPSDPAAEVHPADADRLRELTELGQLAGSAEVATWAEQANRYTPQLHTHDRFGNRVDQVELHPAWHELMRVAVGHGLHAAPWRDDGSHPHLLRAAGFYVWSQAESGHGCPVSMTYAVVPSLRLQPELAERWEPLLAARVYAPGDQPPQTKPGLLAGMGMTEKQGGSDVRANTTTATPDGADGHRLTGHKWFTSAPMNDLFLVLAQAPGGLTCFLLPRVLPDGSANSWRIQRLKDKLGNRSNPSGEIEMDQAWAQRVGPEGRGVATIIEMVAATRLDTILGSAALVRRALAEAGWHAAHRRAFGSVLADTPLMQAVLADLAVEAEAALALGLRLASAADAAVRGDEQERALRRITLPLSKYWVTKRAPTLVAEAMECLGGNGYVEESVLPRLLREAPVNSIWEGSGSVNALDLLRALRKEPAALDAWLAEVGKARGVDRYLDAALQAVLALLADLGDPAAAEGSARRLAEQMALVTQAALLVQHAPPQVADAFCVGRLGPQATLTLGTLPRGLDLSGIVARATPTPG